MSTLRQDKVCTSVMRFDFRDAKNVRNLRKHGVALVDGAQTRARNRRIKKSDAQPVRLTHVPESSDA